MKKLIQSLISLTVVLLLPAMVLTINAQQVKSFKVQNATLEECLKQIEKQTGLGYLSKGEDIKNVNGITFSAQNADVTVILKAILTNTGFTYEINNGVILIIKSTKKIMPEIKVTPRTDLTLRLIIVDETTKEPVTGASALIRQYGAYGVADLEGVASIKNLPTGVVTLEIQMLGYEAYSGNINITSDREMVVALKQTSLELEESVGIFNGWIP